MSLEVLMKNIRRIRKINLAVSTIDGTHRSQKKKEVCPKYDENGKLKQEMVLVENVIRMCM